MGDITDLFSSIAKTKVSPTKSYVSSFGSPADTNEHDTGVTLSVPNNHFYAITFCLSGSGATATARLYEGVGVKQTFTVTSAVGDEASNVFQNTTGSTVTVKLTLQSSSATPSTAVASANSLIEGVNVIRISPLLYFAQMDIWAFITSLDFQFSGQKQSGGVGNSITGYFDSGGTGQLSSTTTANTFTVPDSGYFINSLKFHVDITGLVGAYVAYDWSGKILVI